MTVRQKQAIEEPLHPRRVLMTVMMTPSFAQTHGAPALVVGSSAERRRPAGRGPRPANAVRSRRASWGVAGGGGRDGRSGSAGSFRSAGFRRPSRVAAAGDLLRRRERGAEVIDPGRPPGPSTRTISSRLVRWVIPAAAAEGGDDEVDGVVGERQRSDVADPEAQGRASRVGGRGGARYHLAGRRLRPQRWDRPLR